MNQSLSSSSSSPDTFALQAVDESGMDRYGAVTHFMDCTSGSFALLRKYPHWKRVNDFVRIEPDRCYEVIPVEWIQDLMGFYQIDDDRFLFHRPSFIPEAPRPEDASTDHSSSDDE